MAFSPCRGRMLTGVLCTAALLLAIGFAQGQQVGWVDLLKGGDLTQNWTTTGNWKLDKDGVVSLEPRPGEKGWTRYDAYLWSKKQYKDFEVVLRRSRITTGRNQAAGTRQQGTCARRSDTPKSIDPRLLRAIRPTRAAAVAWKGEVTDTGAGERG